MVDRWLYDVEKREFKKECTKGEGGALLEGLWKLTGGFWTQCENGYGVTEVTWGQGAATAKAEYINISVWNCNDS